MQKKCKKKGKKGKKKKGCEKKGVRTPYIFVLSDQITNYWLMYRVGGPSPSPHPEYRSVGRDGFLP